MTAPEDCYLPNAEEVASEVLDGEAVLINLSNGMYYSIDGVGGRIWELIERGVCLDKVIQDVMSRYDVDEETANADVQTFVNELIAENLVVSAAPSSAAIEAADSATRSPYDAPTLNVFRDMGDLLALDPPMPGLKDIPWKDSTDEPAT
jgi:hypothetical protein